jgi:hypothetical protein
MLRSTDCCTVGYVLACGVGAPAPAPAQAVLCCLQRFITSRASNNNAQDGHNELKPATAQSCVGRSLHMHTLTDRDSPHWPERGAVCFISSLLTSCFVTNGLKNLNEPLSRAIQHAECLTECGLQQSLTARLCRNVCQCTQRASRTSKWLIFGALR